MVNPYEPTDSASSSSSARSASQVAGTSVFIVGLVVLAYGAIAFWLVPSLPPNGGTNGRLPSLLVMGAGIVLTLIGLAVRGLRSSKKSAVPSGQNEIPTRYGLLLLLAIVIFLVIVISQM